MTDNTSNLSATDAAKARRLAFLLTQSVMPQEQKEAWIHLLPIMLPDQVSTLMSILEREHQGYKASAKNFLEDLKKLEQSLEQEISKLKQEEQQLIETYIKKAIEQYDGKN